MHNEQAIWLNFRQLGISPLDAFQLTALFDALPAEYRQALRSIQHVESKPFDLNSCIQLRLNENKVLLSKAVSKSVYIELCSKVSCQPTAQSRYSVEYNDVNLDWRQIYNLPFSVALDTKTRQFQYKLLNRYLATNVFLKKVGIKLSSACSFRGEVDESLEHLFIFCPHIVGFWKDVIIIDWSNEHDIKVDSLSKADIVFGDWERKNDFLLFNHILLIAKKYIYYCKNNSLIPFFRVSTARIRTIYELETIISKTDMKKLKIHLKKWGKYLQS